MLTTTVGTSCQYHPAGPTYDIFVSALVANSCGQAVDSAANFYLDGSVDGNNFEFIARTSMQNYTFQPGQNTLNESFLSVTVADNYQFYRVRAQFYNCGIYSYNSPAAPVCRPGVTPSPTPSPPSISGTVTYGNAIGAPTPPFVTHVWCAEKVRLRLLL